jgi:LPXTG-motif cell wall-anchored protein
MSSLSPPQTGGGNAKYVVVVVLLLGGIAGLLFWRSIQKPAETIVIHAPDAAAPVPVNPHIEDDVPPPVPIVDAGPTPIRTTGGGMERANCGVKNCSGASTPDLETALAFRAKQARRCYESALENDATLKGQVRISVRVASNGQVCSAGVASNDMPSPSVAQCVANKFRQTAYFPAPKGGCVDATVPIMFIPGGK